MNQILFMGLLTNPMGDDPTNPDAPWYPDANLIQPGRILLEKLFLVTD